MTVPRPLALRAAALAAILALATVLAGCGGDTASASPDASAAPATADTSAAPASPGATPIESGVGVGLKATEDAALLSILPEEVDGIKLEQESQAFADAAADADFNKHIERAVFGIVATNNNLVAAVVAQPYKGTYSDAFFTDWRETYDKGACAQAGGVSGTAEDTIGDRTVYVTTCAGGLRTYHTYLQLRGLVVSAFAVGENGFGEKLMAGLRP